MNNNSINFKRMAQFELKLVWVHNLINTSRESYGDINHPDKVSISVIFAFPEFFHKKKDKKNILAQGSQVLEVPEQYMSQLLPVVRFSLRQKGIALLLGQTSAHWCSMVALIAADVMSSWEVSRAGLKGSRQSLLRGQQPSRELQAPLPIFFHLMHQITLGFSWRMMDRRAIL